MFDTIDHNILLKKLYHYGLRGVSNDWVKSYLQNRKQYVKLDHCESDYMDVVCGVPQGSILGPKLFIIYINDMCNVSDVLKFILFADDTNIFCSGHNLKELCELTTKELDNLRKWFAVNRLSLNVTKTNFMVFGNSKHIHDLQIEIDKTKISRVNVTKFLGVLIDEKLNWKDHISSVRSKLSKSLFTLNRAKHVLNQDAMLTVYNSIILPHLTYCCELWGNTYKSNLHDIVILQKKIIRVIHGASYTEHTNRLFDKSKILKFNDIVNLNMGAIMHKAYYSVLPRNVQKFFSRKLLNSDNVTTRQVNKFIQPKMCTTLRSMCISTRGVKFWNSLDDNIIHSNKKLPKFKKALKNWFLSQYSNIN